MKIISKPARKFMGFSFTWWGMPQWYKFRWNKTHIDLGVLSVYDLPQKGLGYLLWRIVSIVIKPLRIWYHWRYVYRIRAQIRSAEWEMNYFD